MIKNVQSRTKDYSNQEDIQKQKKNQERVESFFCTYL